MVLNAQSYDQIRQLNVFDEVRQEDDMLHIDHTFLFSIYLIFVT